MRFAIRLIVGGGGSAILGALWFLGTLVGKEDPESAFKGGIWKGPLLVVAGIGAVIMGVRMLREPSEGSPDDAPAHSA